MKHIKYCRIFLLTFLVFSCQEKQTHRTEEIDAPGPVSLRSQILPALVYSDINPFADIERMSLDSVKLLLDKMYVADQQYRDSLYNGNKNNLEYYGRKMGANDQSNEKVLYKIVNKYGWPGGKVFGKSRSETAWYIVWHHRDDVKIMEKYLPYMKAALQEGNINLNHYKLVKENLESRRAAGFR